MKTCIIFFCLLLPVLYSRGQNSQKITFNQGGATGRNYYEEIPYETFSHLPVVNVEAGGKLRKFLWDTGMTTAISSRLAEELGIQATQQIVLTDANSQKDSIFHLICPELKIGNTTFRNIPGILLPESLVFQCMGIDGVIGSNLLRNSIVQFRSDEKKIILTDQKKRLDLKNLKGSLLYLAGKQSNPVITVSCGPGITIQVLFDSGSDQFFGLSRKNSEEIRSRFPEALTVLAEGYGENSLGIWGKGPDMKKYLVQTQLQIADACFKNVKTVTQNTNASHVGAQLLQYGHITLDYAHNKFYFRPYKQEISFQKAVWPFAPVPDEKCLIVGLIWNNYPEVQLGDKILSVNGINTCNTDRCTLFQILTGFSDAKKHHIRLQTSDGTLKTIELSPLIP